MGIAPSDLFLSLLASIPYENSSFTTIGRLWLSVSMKLPLDLVVFLRPKYPCLLPVEEVEALLFFDVTPATQNKTMARKKHATAAHMKPKAYLPKVAVSPFELKLFRPLT